MKRSLLAILVGIAFFGGHVAKGDIAWNNGTLVLKNGIEYKGDLSYNWKAEILQLKQTDGTIKAFSAMQITSFTYYDNNANLLRHFVSVRYPVRRTLVRNVVMEEIAEGPMFVYRRLRHIREPLNISRPKQFGNDSELLKDFDNFDYFALLNDESFAQLDNFNLRIWPQLENEFGTELRQYIHAHSLDTSNTVTKLILIAQYNALRQQADATAENQHVTTAGQ